MPETQTKPKTIRHYSGGITVARRLMEGTYPVYLRIDSTFGETVDGTSVSTCMTREAARELAEQLLELAS